MANAPKTTTPAKNESGNSSNLFASLAIVICFIVGYLVWKFVMGAPSNFIDNNSENQPLEGNYLGMVYHAGVIVPILIGLFLMVWVFSIERFIVIGRAAGTGNVGLFVRNTCPVVTSVSIATRESSSHARKLSIKASEI